MGNADRDLAYAARMAKKRFYTIWGIIGGIVLLLGFFYLLTLIPIPVGIIIWTMIIVFCLRTPVNFFERHGIGRLLGTALAYVIMFVVLAALIILLFSPMFGFGNQFVNLLQSIPGYINDFVDFANREYEQYANILQNETVINGASAVLSSLADMASSMASQSTTALVSMGAHIANSCIAIGLAFVVAFWILIDLPRMGSEAYRVAGDKYRDDLCMFHLTFTRVMGGYIKATLLQCSLVGIACAILFAVIGIPNAVAIGAITGLLNIIPIVGPWIGGALAAIVGVLINPLIGVIAFVGVFIIQHVVYTFISPKIMQDSVDIHPAITLVVMMVGSALGGIMAGLVGSLVGMLFAIPLVAVMKSLFVYYFEKKSGRRIVDEQGVFFRASPKGEDTNPLDDATSTYTRVQEGSSKVGGGEKQGFGVRRLKRIPSANAGVNENAELVTEVKPIERLEILEESEGTVAQYETACWCEPQPADGAGPNESRCESVGKDG